MQILIFGRKKLKQDLCVVVASNVYMSILAKFTNNLLDLGTVSYKIL